MKFRPFIFIDTNFTRTSQPIFALAVMESRRRIDVPKKVRQLPLKQRVPLVQRAVRHNYATTGGTIPVWGEITGYRYYYQEEKYLAFGIDGELLGKRKGPLPSQATLTVGARSLTMSNEE